MSHFIIGLPSTQQCIEMNEAMCNVSNKGHNMLGFVNARKIVSLYCPFLRIATLWVTLLALYLLSCHFISKNDFGTFH